MNAAQAMTIMMTSTAIAITTHISIIAWPVSSSPSAVGAKLGAKLGADVGANVGANVSEIKTVSRGDEESSAAAASAINVPKSPDATEVTRSSCTL